MPYTEHKLYSVLNWTELHFVQGRAMTMKDLKEIAERCVGPFEHYCSGGAHHPLAGYIAAPLMAFGTTPVMASETLSRIVAFDRAEAAFANITQTNMVQVSSFNGLNGLLLGVDLLPQPLERSPLAPGREGVYSAEPLFAATRSLLGTVDDRHFPIAPGQHLLCAYKTKYAKGPCHLYGAMAIAVPSNRGRNADLFMEDHGVVDLSSDVSGKRARIAGDLLESVRLIGQNLRVEYDRVFISVQVQAVEAGFLGSVLTAAPYLNLAKGGVPTMGVSALTEMTLAEWEAEVEHRFIDCASNIGPYQLILPQPV